MCQNRFQALTELLSVIVNIDNIALRIVDVERKQQNARFTPKYFIGKNTYHCDFTRLLSSVISQKAVSS